MTMPTAQMVQPTVLRTGQMCIRDSLVALKLASVALVGFAAWACLGGTLPLWMFLAIALLSFTIFGGVEGVACLLYTSRCV